MQFLENFVGLIGRRAARDEKPRQCRARFGESLQKAVMRGHDAAGRRARRNESRPGAALPLSDQTPGGQKVRSEEHTSELQSLMRISYDVFCLKKKNKLNIKKYHY